MTTKNLGPKQWASLLDSLRLKVKIVPGCRDPKNSNLDVHVVARIGKLRFVSDAMRLPVEETNLGYKKTALLDAVWQVCWQAVAALGKRTGPEPEELPDVPPSTEPRRQTSSPARFRCERERAFETFRFGPGDER